MESLDSKTVLGSIEKPVKVLIADDTVTDRLILESLLKLFGHCVISAEDGAEAVAKFSEHRPDIVLLDVLMPVVDGFSAAHQIKTLAGEEFVPVIFLTSLSDTDSLVRCLSAGGDDFLSKPYNRVVLQAKITAFARMRRMQTTILSQRNKIASHNTELIHEQNIAKDIFDNIAHSGCLDANNINYYLSPLSIFNGDVLVAGVRPSGNIMALLGDFTGHGLPAAMGSIPLATTFYGMVGKGFSMVDIAQEINRKLKDILPLGMFCCACLIDVNFRERSVKVWNGGLPAGYLVRKKDRSIQLLESRNLPLGILSDKDFKARFDRYELALGDRIFLWSDGVHEARNPEGEMFGEDRLRQLVEKMDDHRALVENIVSSVHGFMGDKERDDDLTVFGLEVVELQAIKAKILDIEPAHGKGLADWSLTFEVQASSFSNFDPLPILLHILNEVKGLRGHINDLYTVLAELYSNALEHGVLRLSSSLKANPEGFMQYYDLRKERLANISEGFIRFVIRHQDVLSESVGGRLYISVIDSGDGFDSANVSDDIVSGLTNSDQYSGRGIALLKTICDSVVYRSPGNQVDVIFSWQGDDQ